MAAIKLTAVFNGIDEWQGSNALSDYKDTKAHSNLATTQAEWQDMWEGAHIGEAVCPPAPELPEGKYAVCVFSCGPKDGEKLETPKITTDESGNLVVDHNSPKIPAGGIPWNQTAQHYYLKFVDADSFKSGVIFRSPRPF